MATLGERIKQLREKKSLSQDDLAKEVGLSKNTVYNYENEKRSPDADALIKLSDYFKVSVDYLLGREMMYLLPGQDDYESVLNKYGPEKEDIHDSFVQLLNAGINIGKSAEVYKATIYLKNCIRSLETAFTTSVKEARESVKHFKIPLLKEIQLDGSPAKECENPSNMLYLLSFMSSGIDSAIIAKNKLSDLLDECLKEYSQNLLSLRYRHAYMKNEISNGNAPEQPLDDGLPPDKV